MPKPRTPKAKAALLGLADKDKARYKNRNEPKVKDGLGEAPEWLVDTEECKARGAWNILRKEVPWLNSSHRMLVATLCGHLGRLLVFGVVGVQASVFIKQCLSEMGATPSAASKVGVKPDDAQKDPADEFFDT